MKRYTVLHCLIVAVMVVAAIFSCEQKKNKTTVSKIHQQTAGDIDSLFNWCSNEWLTAADTAIDAKQLQQVFLRGRALYKKSEWAIEYFFPTSANNINGAPLPEIEPEEHTVIEPVGFQVIEELLFPLFDTANRKELIRESKKLLSVINRVKGLWAGHQFRDDQVFDALRLELYRVITLGISGFDMPASLQSVKEINPPLQSILTVLSFYESDSLKKEINNSSNLITAAMNYAAMPAGFDAFNRMQFITGYINPLSKQLFILQQKLNIPVLMGTGAVNGNAATLFDEKTFDIDFFTPGMNSWQSDEKTGLGKKLFYDPLLSLNNKISCASCHHPGKAFTDGLAKSIATGGKGFLKRNTPTLINAGYQHALFYDMRSAYLEDQVKDVILNKDEVHGSLKAAAQKLTADTGYFNLFKKAFPFVKDTVNESAIQIAIASYIRSLSGFNSAFDKYMRGDTTTMSKEQVAGFNLFMGKAKCGTCHFMPLFNGTVPPSFTKTEGEVIGVPQDAASTFKDNDEGRFAVYKIDEFKNAFKTPTIRNIALTAPYMHNGVFKTLEEVIDFYDNGGGLGLGLNYPNQTLPADKLQLSVNEKKQLIAFMQTLTDTAAVNK
jgi:cytochrome c peroxidase